MTGSYISSKPGITLGSTTIQPPASDVLEVLNTLGAGDFAAIESIRSRVDGLTQSIDAHRKFFTDFPHLKFEDPARESQVISEIRQRWQADSENLDQITAHLASIYSQYGYPVDPVEALNALYLFRSEYVRLSTLSSSNVEVTPQMALHALEEVVLRAKGIIEIVSA